MNFAAAIFANAQGQVLRLVIAAIAAAIYFFINRNRRKALVSGIDEDPRMAGDFVGTVKDYPPPDDESRWNYGWLWVGVALAVAGLVMALANDGVARAIGLLLLLGGSVLAYCDYRFGFSKGKPADVLLRAEFHDDRVCLTRRLSGRKEHGFGPSLALTVECRELTEKSFGADSLKGYGFFMKLHAVAPADVEIPLDFAGVGEFLALARHHGSPLLVSSESPAWFKEKLEALPSWQPGYFQG